jgi:sugar diacid utilization regulator
MKGELLEELLVQPKIDSNITKKLSLLGYDLSRPQFVVLFQLQNYLHDEVLNEAKSLIIKLLLNYSDAAKEQILISDSLGKIKALIPEKIMQHCFNRVVYQFGQSLLQDVKKQFPSLSLLVSISDVSIKMEQIHEKYNEANKALEIAQLNGDKQKVVLFSDIRHISILLDARNPKELEGFADAILGSIYKSDEEKETELIKTLYFYLKNEGNLHQTARILNLSIGGMRYRIQILKEKFNIDLTDYHARREVQMALDIYLAFGKLYSLQLNLSTSEA